ncbi:MAG TPA: hypothetical protein VGQ13_01115 [Nitrososphaera sp.]|jgi:archaellum component FlaG (FlaF/FlaG flagellin family)|nr:hypothetical protein [Nitrososphaera sp.]
MGLIAVIAIIAIVLVAIGLGVGVFFSGLIRGAEIVGQNPTVQNASEETQEFVLDRTDTSAANVLVITTDEATYDTGEPVTITVKNIGDKTLTFPDSSLGLEIQHVKSGQKYTVASAQVITELGPEQSKEITWDGNAPSGDYTATVHTTDQNISGQVSFKIR